MMISKRQQYLLDVIRCLGCVRREQLYTMAQRYLSVPESPVVPGQVDAMLNQLRHGTNIRLEQELVKLPGAVPDQAMLEAVGVMLELAEATRPEFDARQTRPVLLRFSLGGTKIRLFAVIEAFDDIPQITRRHTERVILLTGQAPPSGIQLPDKHFFAVRQADGTHRFFGGES